MAKKAAKPKNPPTEKVEPAIEADREALSPKRELFCQEYIVDLNAKRAYLEVYKCEEASAETHGPRLVRNGQVKKRIDELLAQKVERTKITADYVLATIRDTIERCRQARPVLDMFGKQVMVTTPEGDELVPAYTFQPKEVLKGCELLIKHVNISIEEALSGPNPQQSPSKLSFEQFCEKAGYPAPYPKQVEMMEFVINGGPEGIELPRLLLGARKYGKTDYSTVLGVAHKIYLDPTFTVMIVCKNQENGRRFLREIARCLEANGVTLDVNNANEIRASGVTGKQSSVILLTIGSAGFRSNHPKLIIFDDPVVPGAVSEVDRNEVKLVYSEAMKLTKNIALVGQPVDFRDLYQYLRNIIKTMEVPYGSIPELDDDLDLQRASGVDEKSIQASYFLKVEPEGDATFHDIQRIDKFPEQESIAFMDPSEGGDYTALGIFTGHFQGMAIVGFAWKKRWDLCIPEMKELFKKFKVHKMGFETNKHGTQPLDVLRKALHDIGVSVEGKYTHSNKESRIQLAAQFSKSLYLSKESNPEYIRQVVEYAHDAKFDDSPDTIASFLEWAGMIRPPKAAKKPSKDL